MDDEKVEVATMIVPLPLLRDLFAGFALSGYASYSDGLAWTRTELAQECYAAADAMLAVRNARTTAPSPEDDAEEARRRV